MGVGDLVAMKILAGRAEDIEDVVDVLAAQRERTSLADYLFSGCFCRW